ncbi:hypothetical protein DH2020_041859 [Rehmannia glutinosa]|uniref:peroxidase n=1 Tax=Rehmannia glutinosa TaxID=99300 RepID=A0ABR0UQ06_REHGL
MSFSSTPFPALIFFLVSLASHSLANAATNNKPKYQLSVDFYAKSCPQLDKLIASVTSQQFKEAPISGPATIRLFFHDCFVESLLMNEPKLPLPPPFAASPAVDAAPATSSAVAVAGT